MKRFILCLMLIIPSIALPADEGSISITPKWQTIIESEPRSKVTLVFQLTSNSQETLAVSSHLQMPEGWRMLISDTPLELDPGKQAVKILTFFIPREAQAGTYKVGFYVTREGEESPLESFYFSVNVLPYIGIDVKLKKAPSYMLAGEEFDALFTLFNNSNTDVPIKLDISSGYGFGFELVDIPAGTAHLGPGETRDLTVRVKTKKDITSIIKYRLNVNAAYDAAAPAGSPDRYKTNANAYCDVEIFPRTSEEKPVFHTFPLEISASHSEDIGDIWTGNAGLEISGQGTLDEAGKHRLDLQLRKLLDFPYQGFFSPQDRYSLSYQSDYLGVDLGDHLYSLSPMTEYFRFGRGAQIRGNYRWFGLGGYYRALPDTDPLDQSLAGFADLSFPHPRYLESTIYSARAGVLTDISDRILISLYQRLEPRPEFNFELDIATGSPFSDIFYWAGMVKGQFKYKWISTSANFMIAQPGYPGDFSGRYMFSVNNNFLFFDNTWRLYTTYSQEQRNAAFDESLDDAQLTRNIRLGTRFKWKRFGTDLFFMWKFLSRTDKLSTPDFDELTNGFEISIIQPVFLFEIQGNAGLELTNNRLLSGMTYRQMYSAALNFVPNRISRYYLTFNVNAVNSEYSDDSLRIDWGLGLSYAFVKAKLNLNFINGYFLQNRVYMGTNLYIGSGFDYNFNDIHGLSASAKLQIPPKTADSRTNFSFTVQYNFRPDVPIGRKNNLGFLKGTVFDHATNQPMQDVILRIDDKVVITDKKGSFSFSSLVPGEYFLQIDTNRAGTHLLPDSRLPIIAEVKNKKTTELSIGIVEGGTIEGKVTLYTVPKKLQGLLSPSDETDKGKYRESDLAADSGYPGILIEAVRDDESRRLFSDSRGFFSFQDIRPGQWTIRLFQDYLPPGHYYKDETYTIQVAPGGTEMVDIRIYPAKKVLTIIEPQGSLIENGSTGNEPAEETD